MLCLSTSYAQNLYSHNFALSLDIIVQLQRRNTLDRAQVNNIPKPLIEVPSIESLEADEFVQKRINAERLSSTSRSTSAHSKEKKADNETTILGSILGQLPAIIIVSILNFMVGIPFGASYFPTELSLQGKEVLGLRMFLFSTIVAQFIFTYKSKFTNGIGLQESPRWCCMNACVQYEVLVI